jgi:hypothetical protein
MKSQIQFSQEDFLAYIASVGFFGMLRHHMILFTHNNEIVNKIYKTM